MTGGVTYPCRNKTLLNIALIHTTHPKDVEKDDWYSPATVDDILKVLQGWNPLMHQLAKLSPETTVYFLASREPLPSLARGRAVIVGDAAALMQPHTAQGGTLAIEEAGGLEVLFTDVTKDEVLERAQDFDRVMRKRTHMVQLFKDANQSDPNDPMRLRAQALSDRPSPSHGALPFTHEVREFLYHSNVLEEARVYLKLKDEMKNGVEDAQ